MRIEGVQCIGYPGGIGEKSTISSSYSGRGIATCVKIAGEIA